MTTIILIDLFPVTRIGFEDCISQHCKELRALTVPTLGELLEQKPPTVPGILVLGACAEASEAPVALIEQCHAAFPGIPIILYDEAFYHDQIAAWLGQGVMGYVLKKEPILQLLKCIDVVLIGNRYLSPQGWTLLLDRKQTRKAPLKLGKRELIVALLLAEGKSTMWISRHLQRKPSTISTVKKNIFFKLSVSNIIELGDAMKSMSLPPDRPVKLFRRNPMARGKEHLVDTGG